MMIRIMWIFLLIFSISLILIDEKSAEAENTNVPSTNGIDSDITILEGYFNIGEKLYENGTYVYEYYLFKDDGSRKPYFLKFDKVPPNVFDLSGNRVTIHGNLNSQVNENARFFSDSTVFDARSMAISIANQNFQPRTISNNYSHFSSISNNEFAQSSNSGESSQSGSGPQFRSVPNTLKTVVILSKFSDSAFGEPQTKSYFQGRVLNDSDSLKKYWEDASYGAVTMSSGTIDGTGVVDWQTMPQPGVYYENGGGNNLKVFELSDDAITLADPFIDFDGADNVIQNTGPQIGGPGDNGDDVDQILLVYNDKFDYIIETSITAFAFRDPIEISTAEGTMFAYLVWTPTLDDNFPVGINWENGIGTFAHEMGHNFDWQHTPPPTGIDVYGDPWSLMSGGDSDGPAGPIAFNKDQAEWIPLADVIGVLPGEQKIFTLDTLSDPSPGPNYLAGVIPFSVLVNEPVSIPSGTSIPGCENTNSCYSPYWTTVKIGDIITWTNNDSAAHTVTSGTPGSGPDGIFDSGLISSGNTFAVQFNVEVTARFYYCVVHPWMLGVFEVLDDANYYTVEARIDSTFDQTALNQQGLLIYHNNPLGHSGSPESFAPVNIVDTTGTGDFYNSDLDPGVTWNTGNNIWITNLEENVFVNGENTVTIKVHVNNNAPCLPPLSEDWIIVTSCTMPSSATAPANVLVQNNAVLTIPNGITLNIDFVNNNLTVKSGSGVLIKLGGTIT